MQLISCHYKAFSLIWPLILTFICTYGFKNYWVKYWCCMYEIHVLSVFILNSWFLTILNEMQLVSGPCKRFSCILTVDLDLWMNSLTLDVIFEVENMKCALMTFIEKVCLIIKYRIWHHKIWFLTNFYQMQLISCPYKAFPQIWPLTFICTYWPQIKKNTEFKTEAVCMKFTY